MQGGVLDAHREREMAVISRIAAGTVSLPTGCREPHGTKGVAVTGSPAVTQPSWQLHPGAPGALEFLEADREQLTHLLRGLASRLDELDRHLADLAWRRRTGPRFGETVCERTSLEAERQRLTDRLAVLAQRLKILDDRLSAVPSDQPPAALVGTCPYCGYPSLGSGPCAFCRPHLVR